jgi:hypothetical protein
MPRTLTAPETVTLQPRCRIDCCGAKLSRALVSAWVTECFGANDAIT